MVIDSGYFSCIKRGFRKGSSRSVIACSSADKKRWSGESERLLLYSKKSVGEIPASYRLRMFPPAIYRLLESENCRDVCNIFAVVMVAVTSLYNSPTVEMGR